ncbi:MAG: TerB family tellurite resistance protein [Myxococcales bacterium]|nr:TerB family tellurite resistance protein [Myxococcales bacterium]
MPFDPRRAFADARWDAADDEQPWYVAELALWSATSDDEVEDHEIAAIVETLRQISALSDFTVGDAEEILDEMDRYSSAYAVNDRITALAEHITDPQLRRVSYQLAVYCAASDGELSRDEEDFLHFLQETFGIADDEADRLFADVTG